jgi:hypothetical protein
MELTLLREYFPEGTNGKIYALEQLICDTIELPWKNNAHEISCIPEGKYSLKRRFNTKFGWHLWLEDVPGRTWILIHPANNALTQLKGCIAPVTTVTGHGCGTQSSIALKKLTDLVYKQLVTEKVYLTIAKADQRSL